MVLLPAWCLILVLAAPLSVVSSAFAQGRTAIRAGWLVDVEQGEVRRDQVILVRDGRSPGSL